MGAFEYILPKDRIAQRPVHPYHNAKLLVVFKERQRLLESKFVDLANFLTSKDVLVFNNSRVIPARLFGEVDGHKVEILVLHQEGDSNIWRCIGRPLKKLKKGLKISFQT